MTVEINDNFMAQAMGVLGTVVGIFIYMLVTFVVTPLITRVVEWMRK